MSKSRLRHYKVVLVGVEEQQQPQRRRFRPARRAAAAYFSLSWQSRLAIVLFLLDIPVLAFDIAMLSYRVDLAQLVLWLVRVGSHLVVL